MDDCQKINAQAAESRIPSNDDLPNVEHITQTIIEMSLKIRRPGSGPVAPGIRLSAGSMKLRIRRIYTLKPT